MKLALTFEVLNTYPTWKFTSLVSLFCKNWSFDSKFTSDLKKIYFRYYILCLNFPIMKSIMILLSAHKTKPFLRFFSLACNVLIVSINVPVMQPL